MSEENGRLREVWPHEYKFTEWLKDNIDVLNDVIDLSLSDVKLEYPAGGFKSDLVAKDEFGNLVVIENQLESSDHDHLGKLITYLNAIGANAAIWIVKETRPEHIDAIFWLNESSSASFYLIKIKDSVPIRNKSPEPLLRLIVDRSTKWKDLRHQFWTGVLEQAKESSDGAWGTARRKGLDFGFVFQQHTSHIELYIDRGEEAAEENNEIFNRLKKAKGEIEEAFGEPLEWGRREGRRLCKVVKQFSLGGYRDDEEKWPEIQDAMIDGMIRLEAALRPHIDKLPA